MSIEVKDIEKLSRLSSLEFSDSAKTEIANELGNILDFVSQLQEVNTDNVEPMASAVADASTPERADEVTEQIDVQKNQQNAPSSEMGFYVVPRVVE